MDIMGYRVWGPLIIGQHPKSCMNGAGGVPTEQKVQCLRYIASQRQVNSHPSLKGRERLPRANGVVTQEHAVTHALAKGADVLPAFLGKDSRQKRVNDTGELTKMADTNTPLEKSDMRSHMKSQVEHLN